MTGVSQQKAGRPQSVLFHFRSSYNCCYASGLVVWTSVINSGWKPHHLLAGKSIQPVGVDFLSTSGKFISSGWSGEGFLTVFLSARVCFFIEWFCFLVSANEGPYHLLRVFVNFSIFSRFPFFPAGRAIYLSLSSVHDWGDDDRRCVQADQWRLFLYRTDYCDRRILGGGF